jgi:hypothetical protein
MDILIPSIVVLLCLFDGLATAYVFTFGVEEDAPFMGMALEIYGGYSFIFKALLTLFPCFLFYRLWNASKLARYGCIGVLIIYLATVIAHIWFITAVLW